MRAIATALQPPSGPVFLSLPLDDWEKPCDTPAVVRTVSRRYAPDPARLAEFAKTLSEASSPVLIYGAAIARGNGWNPAVAFAEALGAPVWAAPGSERAPFPENHPLCSDGYPPMTYSRPVDRRSDTNLSTRQRNSADTWMCMHPDVFWAG
jgi:benzoylformate decarboxylase